jgi:hypothetical protein
LFDGTAITKIVIDPTQLNGQYVCYAAIEGTNVNNSGLFRSLDSGVTWQQLESGLCTDVILAGGSAGNGGTGLLQDLYAGFMTGLGTTGGVYFTTTAPVAAKNSLLPVPNAGNGQPGPNQGVNSRINIDGMLPPPTAIYPAITVGPSANPSGTATPVILATPGRTNEPLRDALYQGWVYAYTNGSLFETKDFGANWTQVSLPLFGGFPSNDTTRPQFSDGLVKSLVVDPNNPNVVYLGGPFIVRVDTTKISDVYSFVNFDLSDPTGNTLPDVTIGDAIGVLPPIIPNNIVGGVINDFNTIVSSEYLSMLRDPLNPFLSPSSLQFTGTVSFRNDGSDVFWQNFSFQAGNVNQLVQMVDPLTGNIRLLAATTTGVYSAIGQTDGNLQQDIGSVTFPVADRIGNLQVGEITTTGAEPSTLAADIAGALLFAENPNIGLPASDPNLFQDGNITWGTGGLLSPGWGEAAVADPSGSGTLFRYQYPALSDIPLVSGGPNGNDFFEVNPPGTIPTFQNPGATGTASATTGLILAGDFPGTTGAGEWPGGSIRGSNFAINPLGSPGDYQGMVMSSRAGRIFRASNISLSAGIAGIVWQDIGDPNFLDGTYAPAVTFGSPVAGATNVDDFIYAGTLGGNIFVTFTGGGSAWKKISGGLDGSPVLAISADPARGSHKAVALTNKAVYYCFDTSVANPVWVRLNDTPGRAYIFPNAAAGQKGIQRPVWNNPSDLAPVFDINTGLLSLAVDWRFAIPDNPNNPSGLAHPVLYVGGDGGIVASTDLGATWRVFPNLNVADTSAAQTGGDLPVGRVTDLKLVTGNVNPTTGVPDTSSGLNVLVASMYGRGDFGIKLDTSAYSQFIAVPHAGPKVGSIAPLTGTFGQQLTGITVTFQGAVDPTTFNAGVFNSSNSYVLGPNNTKIPVQYVLDSTPATPAGIGNPHNIYEIVFATPQTAGGTYSLVLQPIVTDDNGNFMNQAFFGTTTFVPNTPPVIGPIPTQEAAPGTTLTVTFVVSDATDPAAGLTLTPLPTSSNQGLVPNDRLNVGVVPLTNGMVRTIQITPIPDSLGNAQTGVTFITLNLTDPRGLMATPVTFEVDFRVPPTVPTNLLPSTVINVVHGHTFTLTPFSSPNPLTITVTATTSSATPITLASTLNGTTLTVTAPVNFVGTASANIAVNDGFATTNLPFLLNVTNDAPTLDVIGTVPAGGGIPVLTVPPSQSGVTLDLPNTYHLADADDGLSGTPNVVTLAGSAVYPYGPTGSAVYAYTPAAIAYELQQNFQFFTTGDYSSDGSTPKWFKSQVTGRWYTIDSTGLMTQYIGSVGSPFATLDPSYFANPAKLFTAPEPTPITANISVNDTTHVVTLNNVAQEVVKISVFDGQAGLTRFFNISVASSPPVFSVPDQQFPHTSMANPQLSIDLTNQPASPAGAVNLTDPNGLPYTTTLAVYNYAAGEAYQLGTSLGLQLNGSYYQNALHRNEKWLYGQATQSWYIIEPNGNFSSRPHPGDTPILLATLDPSYWVDPTLLTKPNTPVSVASSHFTFSVSANNNVLTFNTDHTVAGNFLAVVTVADRLNTTTHGFKLSITDTPPAFTISAPPPTTISHTGNYTATIPGASISDADGDTPTFSAAVYPYLPAFAFELNQANLFYTTGDYQSDGTSPKFFRGATANSWFSIDNTGQIVEYSGGVATPFAMLDPTYFNDPTKLFNAQLPAPLSSSAITAVLTGNNTNGYSLLITPINAAGHLLVVVTATDVAASTSNFFDLNVISPTPSFTVTPQSTSVPFTSSATATVTNISASPDPVTAVNFSASVYSLNAGLAYQLDLAKGFFFTGNYSQNALGLNEKWFRSAVDNGAYIIQPDGTVSLVGSGGITPLTLDGVPVVLGMAYWNDPTLLFNAATMPPPDLSQAGSGTFTTSLTGTNATGLTLTVNPNGKNAGTFIVQVKGADGGVVTSQFFAQTFTDSAPTFGQPANQSVTHQVHTFTLDLTNPASFVNPSAIPSPVLTYAGGSLSTVTLGVKAYYADAAGLAYELNSQFHFFTTGNYTLNALGMGEKWFKSLADGNAYIIDPSGKISRFNKDGTLTFVGQLDFSYFTDPTKLFNAAEPTGADQAQPPTHPTPAVTSYMVDNTHDTVTVNTDPNFVGNLVVKVSATDPAGLATTRFFNLALTGLAPTLSFNPAGTVALDRNGTPSTVELVGNDPDSGNTQPLTYQVSVTDLSAASQAFALQQAQNLFIDHSLYFNYYGQQEIWLHSHTTGAWFGITPDGTVHQLDTAHLLGPVVATLNSSYYNNIQLLLNATQPAPLPIITTLAPAGDPANPDADKLTLTWTNPGLTGLFKVTVTVKNSVGESTTQSFFVNVN